MYSRKFRERVIWALDNSRSIRRVASDFGISTNTVIRWQKNIEPALTDKRRRVGKIDIQALLKDVETYPDAYQYERAERFNCSRSAITRCLKRLNISKKTAQHPSACSVKRSYFCLELEGYQSQGRPIVYLDKSGFKHHVYRHYGYSAKGTLCYGVHNWQLKNTTNAIAA